MVRSPYFLLLLLLINCNGISHYAQVEETLKQTEFNTSLCTKKKILVFDEFSCGSCFNIFLYNAQNIEADYIVLYGSKTFESFKFEDSQLVGYFPGEKVFPVDYKLVENLRKATDTHKGNYMLSMKNCKINSIENF